MRFARPLALSILALVLAGEAYAQPAGPGAGSVPPPSPKAPSPNEAAPPPAAAGAPAKKMTRAERRKAARAARAAKLGKPGMTPNPGRDSSGALPPGGTKGDAGVSGTGSGGGRP
jgi:hypothetical protein